MIGTIKFSSRIQYGKNKKNISYYLFETPFDNKIIVASKLGRETKIDHYILIDIIDNNCIPKKGCINKILGPVTDINITKLFILYKSNILPNKVIKYKLLDKKNNSNNINFTYSIDPLGSKDIDDAFSYDFKNNILQIHITDLTNLNIHNLDDVIFKASTFYDKENYNMLPKELSEDYFSLIEKKERNVISLVIELDNNNFMKIIKSKISINKNLSYEDADKLFENNNDWILMKEKLNKLLKFNDSHEFIEQMMILYNIEFSKFLEHKNNNYPIRIHNGIKFDIVDRFKKYNIQDNLIKKIAYYAAEYIPINETQDTKHQSLNIDKYTHATSPLRRIIDYINQHIAFNDIDIDLVKTCAIINERNNELKKAYRDIKLLELSVELNKYENKECEAYIIEFGEKIKVYISELDILQTIKLISEKVISVFNISIDNHFMELNHKLIDISIKLELYQKIKLKVITKSNESRLNKRIQFHIIDPDIISLLQN